ncbi:MAG TPA: hypothetical protein VHA71_06170 [Rhodanobacteraceae bacterium]|jgi:hypothetical protein|nr:hypothetical protein [Rhodanobacteraceae bacterium]
MKVSSPLIFSLMVGALILQGCATTSSTQPQESPVAAPAPAAVSAQAMTPSQSAAVPEENGKPVVKADTKDSFEAVVAAIHQQMQPGGRWQFIDNSERATIDNSFADMGRLYDQFGSVDKMDQNAKIRLLADQSTVNTILTKKDGDRLICETNVPVGSHFPVKTCKTYAQMQAEENGAQDYLRRRAATTQVKSGH